MTNRSRGQTRQEVLQRRGCRNFQKLSQTSFFPCRFEKERLGGKKELTRLSGRGFLMRQAMNTVDNHLGLLSITDGTSNTIMTGEEALQTSQYSDGHASNSDEGIYAGGWGGTSHGQDPAGLGNLGGTI